jgi:hypothetical protein
LNFDDGRSGTGVSPAVLHKGLVLTLFTFIVSRRSLGVVRERFETSEDIDFFDRRAASAFQQ